MKRISNLMGSLLMRLPRGGVDGEDSEEAVGTGNDARVAMLNSIGDNADRERGDEFKDVNDDGTTADFTAPAPLEEDSEAIAAAEAQRVEEDRVAAEAVAAAGADRNEQPSKLTRKINGVDVEITDALLEKAGKIAIADVYLDEAARLRKEAATKKVPTQEEINKELALDARAIQIGTEEEAAAALSRIIERTKGPSPEDLSKKISDQVAFNNAFDQFRKDYKDISEDPILWKLALDADNDLISKGDTRHYADRWASIGTNLRTWVGSKAPKVEPAANSTEVRQERKAAAPQVPKAAQGKFAAEVTDDKEEAVSDTIAAMAAKRGGPQWMNNAPQQTR